MKRILLPLLLAFSASSLTGALTLSDSFEYGLGELDGQGTAANGWGGSYSASTGRTEIVAGGLSYTAGNIAIDGGNNALEIVGPDTNTVFSRSFASSLNSTFWLSVLFEFGGPADNNSDFMSLWLGGSTTAQIGMFPTSSDGFFARFGTSTDRASGSINPGETYLLVARYDWDGSNFDQINLWVNPTTTDVNALGSPSVATDSGSSGPLGNIGSRLRNWDGSDSVLLDALKIGDEYGDVVTAIPEPSTIILSFGGLLAVAAILRRRK